MITKKTYLTVLFLCIFFWGNSFTVYGVNVALLHDLDDPESDTELIARLTNTLGHTVTRFDEEDNDPVDLAGQDLLIISSTIASGNVAGAYRDVDIPILFTEWAISDEMNISGGGGDLTAGVFDIEIINNEHFISQELPLDFVFFQADNGDDELLYLAPGGAGENAPGMEILAVGLENPDFIFLMAIDQGAELNNGSSAVNRRVFYGIPNRGFNFMNDTAWQTLERIIEWLLELSAGSDIDHWSLY